MIASSNGDWSDLYIGGKNGLILHIMALAWWGKASAGDDEELSKWSRVIKDVAWALEQVCKSVA